MGFEAFLDGIGTRIRKARWLTGKTQQEVAELSGITPRLYAELERGRGNPTARTLYTIAEVLGRTVAELVDVEPKRGRVDLGRVAAEPPKRGRKPGRR